MGKLVTWDFQGTSLRATLEVLPPEALTSSPSEDWRKILSAFSGEGKVATLKCAYLSLSGVMSSLW